jgi:chromosomal replication initiator protein
MTNQQLWQAILGNLELTLSKANFTTWFKNTSIIEKSETGIVVGVPSAFSKEWLQNKYHLEILKALKQLSPETKEVKYQIVSPSFMPNQAQSKEVARTHPRLQENQTLNPKYTFNTFIVGSNNQLAHAASLAVSKKHGQVYNPLFIYGGVGLAKLISCKRSAPKSSKKTPTPKFCM